MSRSGLNPAMAEACKVTGVLATAAALAGLGGREANCVGFVVAALDAVAPVLEAVAAVAVGRAGEAFVAGAASANPVPGFKLGTLSGHGASTTLGGGGGGGAGCTAAAGGGAGGATTAGAGAELGGSD